MCCICLALKFESHLPKKYVISFKTDENAFHFILKVLFNLKIFTFLSRLFGHVEKTA